MDLFSYRAQRDLGGRPLAERMRPRSLDEVVGQRHLLGEGRLLAAGELPSLILWGPPGTGKTTLARLLAERSGARLVALSAVSAGVREVREVIAGAARERGEIGRRTVLFLDEIHRFNKAQQDALLEAVEAGILLLLGATTENPSFEVNAALLSRCRVARLDPLAPEELRRLIDRALVDGERGLGSLAVACDDATRDLLAHAAAGDARRALTTLEVAAQLAPPGADGRRAVDGAVIAEALQHKTLLHGEDEHYDVTSAFIKSLRASDPDAALYWLARLLEAGDDPLFVLRRMVIFASEDIGLADSRALQVAVAATEAVRFVGLPEGWLTLAHAVLFLALAPKSNSATTAIAAAREAVRERGALPVPTPLRNAATRLLAELGHGEGYRYPHDHPGAVVDQPCLPEALIGRRFYEPRSSGAERQLAERLAWLDERRRR